MDTKTFLENFGHIADASNGVQKLRELIFELAVQGNLVNQDSNEEGAYDLLKRIEKDKCEVAKKKLYGKLKQLPSDEIIDPPFELPNCWSWSLLDNVSHTVHYGYTASAKPELTDVRLLRITDIQNNRVNWETVPGCEINDKSYKANCLRANDILIARTGGTIGKTYLVENLPVKAVFASYLIRVVPSMLMSSGYLKLFMESPLYWGQLYAKSAGTGQPNVNATSLRALQLPIPPLEEQKRIVTKVDQLMALCEQFETQQKQKAKTRVALNNAAIDKLLTAQNPDEFNRHWQRIANNFHQLYDHLENLAKLRGGILDLAVQGKLVEQDANEESAFVLLERIQEDKEALVKKGIIKKQKDLPEITEEEKLFDIPDGWVWIKFGQTAEFINGDRSKNYPNKNEYVDKGVPWINTGHIEPTGYLTTRDMNFIKRKKFDSLRSGKIQKGDLVYCLRGATFGKTAFVEPYEEGAIASSLMIIRPYLAELNKYIYRYLISPFGKRQLYRFDNGSAQPNLSANSVMLYAFPLPPLEEQKRIVAKVDQLMALCDQLEAKLKQTQTTNEKLVAATVYTLVAA